MVMGEARALAVAILMSFLGLVQVGLGTFEVISAPETVLVAVPGGVKLLAGLVLLPAARDVAKLRKRGLGLGIIGFPSITVAHLVPLVMGDVSTLSVASVVLAMSLLLYLFLHEDALGPKSERHLSEDMNTHEFIR